VKNAVRTQCRCNAQNHAHKPRVLNNAFAAVADRKYHTPIGAIVEAALLANNSHPTLRYKGYSI
jgi:hypothetical protein